MSGCVVSAAAWGGMEVLVEDCAGLGDQAANLALEEALVRAAPPRPLLRIWQNGACVVIGRGQQMWREVNMAACAASSVPVLRRASGGGTVYHDLGNLNISLVVPGREPGLAAELAALLAAVAGRLGLRASTRGRGVFIGSAKVSGLASQVTRDGTVAHATLLVTTPTDRVQAYLAPAPPDRHALDSQRSPVLPLCAYDPALDITACRQAVLAEASSRYGPLSPRPLRPEERRWQARLLAERYQQDSWHRTGQNESSTRALNSTSARLSRPSPVVIRLSSPDTPRGRARNRLRDKITDHLSSTTASPASPGNVPTGYTATMTAIVRPAARS